MDREGLPFFAASIADSQNNHDQAALIEGSL
jgi:hypothetical protein